MNPSIKRHLDLVMSFMDKGFDSGTKRAKLNIDAIKKAAREAALVIGALVAAFGAGTVALFKFIAAGAKIRDVETTFNDVRKAAGLLPDTLEKIVEATRGVVTNIDIMKASTQALADSLDPGRLVELWAKAKQISEVMPGVEITQAFEMLHLAIAKGQTRMLTQIGITIDAEEAANKYAASIGKTTAELTHKDRQIAVSIALEERYLKQFKALGEQGNDNAERFQRFSVQVRNLKDKFFAMLSDSPAVEKFMNFLLEKMEGLSTALDNAEPKIQAVVTSLMEFYQTIVTFIDEKAEPAIQWVSRYKEELLGLGVALATFSTLSRFGVPLPYAAGAGAIAGAGAFIGAEAKGFQDELERYNREMATNGIPNMEQLLETAKKAGIAIEEYTNEALRDLLLNLSKLGEAPALKGGLAILNEPTFPGDKAAGAGADVWKQAGGGTAGPWEDIDDLLEQNMKYYALYYDGVTVMAQDYVSHYKELVLGKEEWEIDLMYAQINSERRGMEMRRAAYEAGYAAMGRYADKFYAHGAHMGRVLNAMLIAGTTEMVAHYIEAKTKQARIDFMEATYQAIRALAMGDLRAASLWGQTAAGAGAMAGAGALAAGYVRRAGMQRADELAAEQEQQWTAATAESTAGTSQRRQASGIVNSRPITVQVYSTVNINSGYNIFGDGEAAVNDLYGDRIRDKIADDIESGMIAVPA